ncbi:MAG: glutaredoxin [Burkholderiales bacterium RIFCSPLOWO2_12_67_14]|nr:MAG: glutaredoxin [Burkholderiales bacterium RIFCSPLOWO2_02_FULL_67_64]OGB42760.1 MAG: glutaredoxin [Burkholderiales bacterium RIFCSPLOWO2_12_67_14]OGB51500.1 MAG: glutaredoxin [Burkholderiales bacterium RIFCSPHIGHO2_12_FULL_67_38]OGB77115.1 MAG: glutaredoxin [Burkholderiales bacterium RIFCSPLOWO2_12_FULL_67_210]
MMDIKVLGTGCTNCRNTIALIDQVAKAKGVEVKLEKVEELRDIMGYGVMSTPGVVINGKVVHAGGVPSREKIEQWFSA